MTEVFKYLNNNLVTKQNICEYFLNHRNEKYVKISMKDYMHICWQNVHCMEFPKNDFIIQNFETYLDVKVSNDRLKDIIYITNELISNAFRSKAEFNLRKDGTDGYKQGKEKQYVCENCETCIQISFESYKMENGNYVFIVKSFNDILRESVERIEKMLNSDEVDSFSNFFVDNFDSFTGNSGVGIFTVNSILKSNFNSILNFEIFEESVCFYFEIDKSYLK